MKLNILEGLKGRFDNFTFNVQNACSWLSCFRFYHRIRISNSIISTVNHYSTTTTIALTITPSTHVHTYNYNHVCYMCSAHVQILHWSEPQIQNILDVKDLKKVD